MRPPSALAETVTPPIFSPAADVIAPVRSASACAAPETPSTAAIAIRLEPIRLEPIRLEPIRLALLHVMAFSVLVLQVLVTRLEGLEIGGDGGDLLCTVGVFEARHARRAVRDGLAHDL